MRLEMKAGGCLTDLCTTLLRGIAEIRGIAGIRVEKRRASLMWSWQRARSRRGIKSVSERPIRYAPLLYRGDEVIETGENEPG